MIYPKTPEEIKIMKQGGKKLAKVKEVLLAMIRPGVRPIELEEKAEETIARLGAEASFKKVKGYNWATCINVNEGVVHGIPNNIPFQEGDLVSCDVGVYYKGFHTDSAFTVGVGQISEGKKRFLEAGRHAQDEALKKVRAGNRVSDISKAINDTVRSYGYSPVYDLTGHGVGRNLHEEPFIPCFWDKNSPPGDLIPEGAVLAVEVIYTAGSPKLVLSGDGWTINTKDGKIAGLFEETIAVLSDAPMILTT